MPCRRGKLAQMEGTSWTGAAQVNFRSLPLHSVTLGIILRAQKLYVLGGGAGSQII